MVHQPIAPQLPLGALAPDFTLRGTDGKEYSLHRQKGANGTVVIFSCNHCPYVKAYDARINELALAYLPRGVAFFVVNANDADSYPEDNFEKMKQKSAELKLAYPYLRDETQQVATEFGAGCTPEVFAFDHQLRLVYRGRVDDNMEEPQRVTQRYLRDACEAMLAHREPRIKEAHPIGCSIKWSTH